MTTYGASFSGTVTHLNVEQMELGHLVTLGKHFMKLVDLADLTLFPSILRLSSLISAKPTNCYLHKLSKGFSYARRLLKHLRTWPAFPPCFVHKEIQFDLDGGVNS